MPIPEDAIIRINLAWVKDINEAKEILNAVTHHVYLDFPDGRKKPPKPTISLEDALLLAEHEKVMYFAISNAENIDKLRRMKDRLMDVILVPKIETTLGVMRMQKMIDLGIDTFMLDKEDLYTDVDCDPDKYGEYLEEARSHKDVKILELNGVVFI